MDRENALRYLAKLIEYGKVLEKRSDVAAKIEEWEAIVAKSQVEVVEAEKELLKAEKELLEAEKEYLRKEMEDFGSVLVDDASQIDVVENLIKDHKLVCDFYTADPEIMEEMRRRGLPIHPYPC